MTALFLMSLMAFGVLVRHEVIIQGQAEAREEERLLAQELFYRADLATCERQNESHRQRRKLADAIENLNRGILASPLIPDDVAVDVEPQFAQFRAEIADILDLIVDCDEVVLKPSEDGT